ncbi:uncharacterized protein [Montipora capricornis]|uniref:uncharacterized protein n=1 Tax=Montipora capricornis TaxID=246305 RepID=UPI0035F14863
MANCLASSLKKPKCLCQLGHVHVSDTSPIGDHCMTYALSDPHDSSFRQKCPHIHHDHCAEGVSLSTLLDQINRFVEQASFQSKDDRDEATYVAKHSKEAIESWKAHHLRSVRQDQSRLQILEKLDSESVYVTQDWAMKFLPRKYRESQSDWFGKRGISWHISVAVRRHNEQLESQGFIHIIQNCTQGSSAVVPITTHVLKTLKTEHPEVKRAFFRQDNAGCYHSTAAILSVPVIERESGVQVIGVDFSDPQGGKGPADRMAATVKGHFSRFVNEGNNVTNAKEMEKAILSHGGLPGIRVAVIERLGETETLGLQQKIAEISKLNNFSFSAGRVKVWKAFDIGPGKNICVEGTNGDCESQCRAISTFFSPGDFKELAPRDSRKKEPNVKTTEDREEGAKV